MNWLDIVDIAFYMFLLLNMWVCYAWLFSTKKRLDSHSEHLEAHDTMLKSLQFTTYLKGETPETTEHVCDATCWSWHNE
jgi:hypothetical protein